MPRYYVLIKRKGSSRWLGAIPAKPGKSKGAISSSVRKNLKAGFSAKVVTADAIRRLRGRVRASGRKRRLSAKARRKMLANLRKARRKRR